MLEDLAGVFADLGDKVVGWGRSLVLMIPNIIAALVILIASVVLSKLLARLFCRVLSRAHFEKSLQALLHTLMRAAVIMIGGIVAMQVLQLDKAATTLLAGAGIIGLALGFAFQDFSANLIAGVALAVRRPMRIGDIIETNDIFGRVESIQLRTTFLRQPDGKRVMIPNRKIFEETLTNYSEEGHLRVEVTCGVSYGDDLELTRDVVLDALATVPHVTELPLEVLFEEFGDSSIQFVARFWIDFITPADLMRARSAAIMAIRRAFTKHGLTIPFPIRTLDFGIRGGEALEKQLADLGPGGGRRDAA
ncbi:MAG TPA: mechanosensitive ion channel [Kofleriaceae bacterium]|nr:mechanosensitive ion channel [Kofleriaceae bacterium]